MRLRRTYTTLQLFTFYFLLLFPMKLKKVITKDGSYTLYDPRTSEHYHSVYGAIQESRYIFLEAGFNIELLPGPPGKRHMLRAWKGGLQNSELRYQISDISNSINTQQPITHNLLTYNL